MNSCRSRRSVLLCQLHHLRPGICFRISTARRLYWDFQRETSTFPSIRRYQLDLALRRALRCCHLPWYFRRSPFSSGDGMREHVLFWRFIKYYRGYQRRANLQYFLLVHARCNGRPVGATFHCPSKHLSSDCLCIDLPLFLDVSRSRTPQLRNISTGGSYKVPLHLLSPRRGQHHAK